MPNWPRKSPVRRPSASRLEVSPMVARKRWISSSVRPMPLSVTSSVGGCPRGAVTASDIKDHLVPLVAKWCLPSDYAFIDEVPKTSVGKFDKKQLRRRLADGELQMTQAGESAAAETAAGSSSG